MRSSTTVLSVAALAGVAMASPAPQQLDFNAIAAAPAVQSAPLNNGVPVQTATLVSVGAITTTATASVTGAATSAAVQKRDVELEKRTFGIVTSIWCSWFGIGCPSTSSSATTTSTSKTSAVAAVSTQVSSATAVVSTQISSAAAVVTSSYTPYYPALATVTQYTTGTTTISSTSACPTTPEEGTYCGFINPEDPCAPQPDGYGPVPTPDTVDAFLSYAPFHSMASAAPTTIAAAATATASGVATVYQQTFKDLNAFTNAQSYLGLLTLQTYDTAKCAAYCDSTALCTAFNMFIERGPSVNPTKNDSTAPTVWGYWCPNPASMTSYKCTIWGSNIDNTTATNDGQWREDFHVVITGSNGYDKTNVTVPTTPTGNSTNGSTWSKPVSCSSKAINAPNYWMGSKFFPGPFNAQLCADYAVSQNVKNKAAAIAAKKTSYTPCNMFNSYYLHKNGQPHGTYCALYDTDVSTKYATYQGGASGSDNYSCKQSYKFTLNTQDSGKC